MADISIINDGNTDYNVKDAVCRSALAEVENKGAKNRCPYNGFVAASAGTVINKQPINLPKGGWVLSYTATATTNSIAVRLLKNDTSLWNKTIGNTGGKIVEEFTIADDANQITFYTGVGNTVSSIMICSKAEWNISQTYEPYTPTNLELRDTKYDYGTGTEIPENADLNNYTQIGKYHSPNSARSSTLLHTPYTSSGFYIIVEKVSSDIIQSLWPVSTTGQTLYRRIKSSSEWGSWYKFEGTEVT